MANITFLPLYAILHTLAPIRNSVRWGISPCLCTICTLKHNHKAGRGLYKAHELVFPTTLLKRCPRKRISTLKQRKANLGGAMYVPLYKAGAGPIAKRCCECGTKVYGQRALCAECTRYFVANKQAPAGWRYVIA